MLPADDDSTIRVRSPAARRPAQWRAGLAVAVLLGLLGAGGGIAWYLVHPAPLVAPPAGAPATPASEAQIAAHRAELRTVFRFQPNPRVLVIDFPSLLDQGRMLNRVAVFIEKIDLPHDRLLDDGALDAVIRRQGATVETYYYGHDYRAADLARFFAAADRQGLKLTAEEEWLRGLVRQEGWMQAAAQGALISIPKEGADSLVDAKARATILHHELSHAEYFSNPAYAAYVASFWRDGLTEAERAAFRHYLAEQGYDPAIEDLMMNEMQAYLMHTADVRFFRPADVGLSADRLHLLQAKFLLDMPKGWLRDCTSITP